MTEKKQDLDKDLEISLKAAEIFWAKFGKYTTFESKEDYISWVKQRYFYFKKLSKKDRQAYTEQHNKLIQKTIDNIDDKRNKDQEFSKP